ncbi:hypothetical protein WAI453_009119 [Rhynchosporium graminicola]
MNNNPISSKAQREPFQELHHSLLDRAIWRHRLLWDTFRSYVELEQLVSSSQRYLPTYLPTPDWLYSEIGREEPTLVTCTAERRPQTINAADTKYCVVTGVKLAELGMIIGGVDDTSQHSQRMLETQKKCQDKRHMMLETGKWSAA